MNKNTLITVVVVAALILLGILLFSGGSGGTQSPADSATSTSNGDDVPAVSTVSIALLDYTGEATGVMRGCDSVVMAERDVPRTTMPLTAALEELFSIQQEEVAGWNNFIAKTKDTLSFERAIVEGGTAHIYLSGELSGLAGVCDNPRARIQIEETALQFPTVENVQLYLNGEATELQPDGRG